MESDSIKDIVTHLNRPMYRKTSKQMFTALCLAVIDIKTKKLTFTNAGLSEPLLKTKDAVYYLEGAGPKLPLGSVRDTIYQEKQIQLNQGDVLILFTDGIPEAHNSSKAFYGYDRLKNLLEHTDTKTLTADQIKESIIQDVKRFAGSTPQYDDMTMVIVKLLN
jgi:sigma-B regulation protein RsbU (phosphoserine phosphatase)